MRNTGQRNTGQRNIEKRSDPSGRAIRRILLLAGLVVGVMGVSLCLAPEMVQAADSDRAETDRTRIDGGDARYWDYYDAQGNPLSAEEKTGFEVQRDSRSIADPTVLEADAKGKNASADATDSLVSLYSPYKEATYYIPQGNRVSFGVDVSRYQPNIDWEAVKSAGIDTVMIRCGFRGYQEPTLSVDDAFEKHIEGALAAGLKVGIYIYSQATTAKEAKEEARLCLDTAGNYLDRITLPIAMDVEYASNSDGTGYDGYLYRAKLTRAQQTAVCQAFCQEIQAAGKTPMVYGNWSMLTAQMNTATLKKSGILIWMARYNTRPDPEGKVDFAYDMWQYSQTGKVQGITDQAGNSETVDVNFVLSPLSVPVWKSVKATDYKTVQLSWKPVEGAEGYLIYRSTKADSQPQKAIKDTTAVSWKDTTAPTGSTCYYTVKAYCRVDGNKSATKASAQAKAKPVLAAPKLQKAVSADYNSLKISWKKTAGADGYRIYRKTGKESYRQVAQVKATQTVYQDKNSKLQTGKKYTYTVKAYRTVNKKAVYSSYDKKGVTAAPVPSTPSIKLKSAGKGKVTVSWNRISGASGYVIYSKTSAGGSWKTAVVVKSGKTLSRTVSAKSKKTVYYAVRAFRTVNGKRVYSSLSGSKKIQVK